MQLVPLHRGLDGLKLNGGLKGEGGKRWGGGGGGGGVGGWGGGGGGGAGGGVRGGGGGGVGGGGAGGGGGEGEVLGLDQNLNAARDAGVRLMRPARSRVSTILMHAGWRDLEVPLHVGLPRAGGGRYTVGVDEGHVLTSACR